MPDPNTVSTGVPQLDAALGGLYWGDNVVWELDDGGVLDPFVAGLLRDREQFNRIVFVRFEGDLEGPRAAYPDVEVLDARQGSAVAEPFSLLTAVREHARRAALGDDLRLARPPQRPLGRRRGAAVLHARLSHAARSVGGGLLVAHAVPPFGGPPSGRRRHDAVRPRAGRRSAPDRKGGRPPARGSGQRLPPASERFAPGAGGSAHRGTARGGAACDPHPTSSQPGRARASWRASRPVPSHRSSADGAGLPCTPSSSSPRD